MHQTDIDARLDEDIDVVTSSFKPPTNKQKVRVNLYDPHKAPEQKETPGPAHYFAPKGFKNPNDEKQVEPESDSDEPEGREGEIAYGLNRQKGLLSRAYK